MSRRKQQGIIWTIGMVVTAVMLALGIWQMDAFRDQGREALIARINEPAAGLLEVAPVGQLPQDAYGRTVEANGVYLPAQQLLIREPDGSGSTRVLTAFQLSDGSIVPVVRGEVADINDVSPAVGTRIQGVFLPSEGDVQGPSPEGQLGSIRLPRLAQLWIQPMIPGFVVLDDDYAAAQGLPAAEVALPSNEGQARNQGYALQWWIFAAAAVAATVKLSRDAAKGTGFMTSGEPPVDESGDNVDNLTHFSAENPSGTEPTGTDTKATVDKSPGA